jgi:hypothetical protein
MKIIMSDEKSDDIDSKIYAAFSYVDCDQEFESRQELEEHDIKHQNMTRTDTDRQ